VKLSFESGEIDFIVGQPMTAEPSRWRDIEGIPTRLETVPEIIAKKIVYRGASIKPRDIFDIAAAVEADADPIRRALRDYSHAVGETIKCLDRLNPGFVEATIHQLMIRDRLLPIADTAMARTREFLQSV
jgi:hypothetical protein